MRNKNKFSGEWKCWFYDFRFVPSTGKRSVLLAMGQKVLCMQIPLVNLLIIFTVTIYLFRKLIMEEINNGKQCVNSLKYNILCERNNFYINLCYANFFFIKCDVHYLCRAANWCELIELHFLHSYIALDFVSIIQNN